MRHMRCDHEDISLAISTKKCPCMKAKKISITVAIVDKAEDNMHDELSRSTRILSNKADNLLYREPFIT